MNKTNFFFSIIIPTFNDLDNLKNCVYSLKRQTYNNFETIIVNDGSSDNTGSYLDKLKLDNLIIINLKKNNGPAFARNQGILNSRGEWICFLDSDDFWIKTKLEIIKNIIYEKKEADLICHNQILKKKNSRYKKKLFLGPIIHNLDNYKNLILNGNFLALSSTCVKSEFLKSNKIIFDINKRFISVEDYDFWLNIALHNGKFFFENKFLGFYLKHDKNITNKIFYHKKNLLFLLYKHVFKKQNFCKNKKKLWKKILSKHIIELIVIYFLSYKNYKICFYLLLKYIKKFKSLFLIEVFFFIKRKLIKVARND